MNLKKISRYILSVIISLLLLPSDANAQVKKFLQIADSTAWFQGVEVSADLVGLVMKTLGDYGQFEAGMRVNLKDRFFPAVELGYGMCDHTDDATNIHYKTNAPYAKVGIDFNLLKNKHDVNRIYAGVRYAFTSFSVDYDSRPIADYYWGGKVQWGEEGMKCNYHWAELLFGIQSKIWGPFHLGWTVRYQRRISYKEGEHSKVWYVPGFGKRDNSAFGATFNVIVVI